MRACVEKKKGEKKRKISTNTREQISNSDAPKMKKIINPIRIDPHKTVLRRRGVNPIWPRHTRLRRPTGNSIPYELLDLLNG